jgi:AraC-like DNA-binding protein
MLDNVNLTLLAGGFYRCTPQWNKRATGLDRCYKCYVPVEGEARLETDAGPVHIGVGQVYLISGFHLRRQVCARELWVYWVHFVPESLFLRYLMDQGSPVQAWPRDSVEVSWDVFRDIPKLFEQPFTDESHLRPDPPPSLTCWLQSFLLTLLSRQLGRLEEDTVQHFQPQYYRLKPAIDFMDERFTANPPLAEVASRVNLAPTYFHRLFTEVFGITPFAYMLTRRLNLARHLLTGTALSVKEIAERTGYDNSLYFSRVFARHIQESPTGYRKRESGG